MVKVYVEGGGNQNPGLAQDVRKGFKQFFEKAGFNNKPAVIVCGSRQSAYEDYCLAVSNGTPAVLLVDSEAPIDEKCQQGEIINWKPWEHLQNRKNSKGELCDLWEKVGNDIDCHLMVQMMEAWFLADVDAVKAYYRHGFSDSKFPSDSEDIEKISKTRIKEILTKAADETAKAGYSKGRDSFAILELLDPSKVEARSNWAKRFIYLLKEKIDMLP